MKKNKITVFVDVDDVCAVLWPVWYTRYNSDYKDNLSDERVTDWNTHNFVKPECGIKIYEYLKDPSLYDFVIPREHAKWGVNRLRDMGFRVIFATSTPIETAGRKFHWLKQWEFNPEIREYIEIGDKSLLHGDFMIDDCYGNVKGFSGQGYLLSRPWNIKHTWHHRVTDWIEFVKIMENNKNVQDS